VSSQSGPGIGALARGAHLDMALGQGASAAGMSKPLSACTLPGRLRRRRLGCHMGWIASSSRRTVFAGFLLAPPREVNLYEDHHTGQDTCLSFDCDKFMFTHVRNGYRFIVSVHDVVLTGA